MTTIDGVFVTEWGEGPRALFIHGGTPGGGAAAGAAAMGFVELSGGEDAVLPPIDSSIAVPILSITL